MKHKTLARNGWQRILAHRDAHQVLAGAFEGEAYLIQIDAVTAPLAKECCGRRLVLADAGYSWLQVAPKEGYWWLTAMFGSDGKAVQFYFDLTAGSELLGSGESGFDDLYLDVVLLPDGQREILDADELDEAERLGLVSPETAAATRERAQRLMENVDAGKMSAFCEELFRRLSTESTVAFEESQA